MASPAKKTKATAVPECPYGAGCYRKNPQHFIEFFHPKKSKPDPGSGDDDVDAGPSTSATKGMSTTKSPGSDDSSLPVCKYGAKCYRKNLLHFAEYSHPTKAAAADGSDTDELIDTDDDAPSTKKPAVKKDVKKGTDILNRGMSLVKNYSAMSEDERKELIKKAFEAKKQLQDELDKTKKEMKKKEEEVEKLQKEVATGLLLMDGEKEALEGKVTKYFELVAERDYKEGSAAQTHFRLAESQFYRLLVGQSNYRITKVEYVVNPELSENFRKCRENLKTKQGEQHSYPVLAFHGTQEASITPICKTGFRIPGESGFTHRTDTGWYGKGVYFSEYPSYSMSYIQGSIKLLLCQVLPGKIYHCSKLIHGAALQKGFDSHTSPDKKELVIFNKYHILPSYIVHYTPAVGEFKYSDTSAGKKTPAFAPVLAPILAPALALVKAFGKGKKKGVGIDDNLLDPMAVAEKYNKAAKKKATKALKNFNVTCSGTFTCSQKDLLDLAVMHGATKGTKVVFNILVTTQSEYDIQTAKVQTAQKKHIPIVAEAYLYDCIIKGKHLDDSKYKFE